jgi:hypothetical protein
VQQSGLTSKTWDIIVLTVKACCCVSLLAGVKTSSNVEEMIESLLGTQLVSLPQQHMHAHFAFRPEVSHEKQT